MTITLSSKRKEEARDALQASRLPDLRVLRRLPPTRYCAYRSVLSPQVVAQCQCWRCTERRELWDRQRKAGGPVAFRFQVVDNMTPAVRELEAEIARWIDEIEPPDFSASFVGEELQEVKDGD